MQGDLRYFNPGQAVPVELVANSEGEIADRGDVVELVGESGGRTQVALCETRGEGVGHLHRRPKDYDEDDDYEEGDAAGVESATIYVDGPVDWFNPVDDYEAEVDDLVVFDDGGIDAFDDEGDAAEQVAGRVFATGTRETGMTAEKAAIIRRV